MASGLDLAYCKFWFGPHLNLCFLACLPIAVTNRSPLHLKAYKPADKFTLKGDNIKRGYLPTEHPLADDASISLAQILMEL